MPAAEATVDTVVAADTTGATDAVDTTDTAVAPTEPADAAAPATDAVPVDPSPATPAKPGDHQEEGEAGAPVMASPRKVKFQSVMRHLRSAASGKRTLYGQKVSDLRALFAAMDSDASGSLSREEFRGALVRLDLPLTPEQMDVVIEGLDMDGNDQISLAEFLAASGMDDTGETSAETAIRKEQAAKQTARGEQAAEEAAAVEGSVMEALLLAVSLGAKVAGQVRTSSPL